MTTQEAINKINSYSNFSARLDSGKIIVDYYFRKNKNAGFISPTSSELSVGFCGSFTSQYNSTLKKIEALNIDWLATEKKETKTSIKTQVHSHHYSSKSERDWLNQNGSWELTHDL